MTATGNLSVEAQERYRYIEQLLREDVQTPARVVELGSAPGTQIAQLAVLGYEATSVDIGTSTAGWGGKPGKWSSCYSIQESRTSNGTLRRRRTRSTMHRSML